MAHETSYPDPDPGAEAMHPYANQYLPPSGHSHISHPAEATMQRDGDTPSSFLPGNGHVGAHAQPATAQQLAQRSLDVNQGPGQASDPSSRKRSKVSRACDECRRKKIRCDADSETPGTACSSCRRAGTTCAFSRAPQKRGPSKGYIKDLAERVNNLEYRAAAAPPVASEFQYSPVAPGQGADYLTPRDPATNKRSFDAFAEPEYYETTYNTLQTFNTGHAAAQNDASAGEAPGTDSLQSGGNVQPQLSNMNATEVHADAIDTYYRLIHPTLPLLPHGASIMQNIVQRVTAGVCEAFFSALEGATVAVSRPDPGDYLRSATEGLTLLQGRSGYFDTMLDKVVYLEALILMVIACDNIGPSSNSTGMWIGLALEAASSMRLQYPNDTHGREPHTLGDLGRRAWLILFILDRWHAFSHSDVLRIPENTCKLVESDRQLLIEGLHQTFRLSRMLGHLSEAIMYHPDELKLLPSNGGLLGNGLDHEFELYRDLQQSSKSNPHINLGYLHLKQIFSGCVTLYTSTTAALAGDVFQIVALLRETKGAHCTPWIHNIIGLAAFTLGRMADRQLHSGATEALRDLRDILENSYFRPRKVKTGWDIAIIGFIDRLLENGAPMASADGAGGRDGLGQLADAAIGNTSVANGAGESTSGNPEGRSNDQTDLIQPGYMTIISEQTGTIRSQGPPSSEGMVG